MMRRRFFVTLLSVLVVAGAFLAARPAYAADFTVVNTNNVGAGSLRQAILDANAKPGADAIKFNIPGAGVKTIAIGQELPHITDPVTIDGYTQPGAKRNTKGVGTDAKLLIQLKGSLSNGLYIKASNTKVSGLVINRFGSSGIKVVYPAEHVKIEGNYIGIDPTGTLDLGINSSGIELLGASHGTIGGSSPGARNVVSGNIYGIKVSGGLYGNADGNAIVNNYLGTDATGGSGIGNALHGVVLASGSSHADIQRNLISGNDSFGVVIGWGNAVGNRLTSNYIGTNATGTAPVANWSGGVAMDAGARNNSVGAAGGRNLISGNEGSGVSIYGGAPPYLAEHNTVHGNYIGTDVTGKGDLGNAGHGVEIHNGYHNRVGAAGQAPNVVAFNGGDGIAVTGEDAAFMNTILGNSVFSNDGLGIDLKDDGVSPNSPSDPGPNQMQDYPVLDSAVNSGGSTTVSGRLANTGTSGVTYTIQFFSSPDADPSGNGEGGTYLGQTTATSNRGGASFGFTATPEVPAGHVVTATATSEGFGGPGTGDTSEFSKAIGVVARPPNDGFANARAINGTAASIPGTNLAATREQGEPSHLPSPFAAPHSVWYRWTTAHAGRATIDACQSGFDSVLAVYTGGALSALTKVAASQNGCASGPGSKVTFNAQAGATYSIAVAGVAVGDEGPFTLALAGPDGCTVRGTPGNDVLTGTRADEVICGYGGDDQISGEGGNDIILGGNGSDDLVGGADGDRLFGETGNDALNAKDGVAGNDLADGGWGADSCTADGGDTLVSCP